MPAFDSKTGTFGRSAGFTTAFQGFTQLSRALRRIEDGASDELRQKLREIGDRVGLVAASYAPRGDTGALQHSMKTSVTLSGASVYSSSIYGGAQNYGAWSVGRGPHISRASASHYMDRAVATTQAFVEGEVEELLDWLTKTFEED